jgi:hypothetical protein
MDSANTSQPVSAAIAPKDTLGPLCEICYDDWAESGRGVMGKPVYYYLVNSLHPPKHKRQKCEDKEKK